VGLEDRRRALDHRFTRGEETGCVHNLGYKVHWVQMNDGGVTNPDLFIAACGYSRARSIFPLSQSVNRP
jgi:hypothetical protein